MDRIAFITALATIVTNTVGCDLSDLELPGFDELPLDGLTELCPEALESGDPADCDGEYVGTIVLELMTSSNVPLAGCVGDAVVLIDSSAETSVMGEGSCTFDGLLESLGEQDGWFEGDMANEDPLQGELELGDDIYAEWSGGYDADGAIVAGFEGSYDYQGIEIRYQGILELD